MILHLLEPILNLHGWWVYLLVGGLVFAEAAMLIGFVFPGETAVILGGVIASRGHVSLEIMLAVVVICAIAGDSMGYYVGEKVGPRLLGSRIFKNRQRAITSITEQLARRGAVAVFVARFTAFLRAVVPGLAGMSDMPYRTFLPANAAGGIVWGVGYTMLGYLVGNAYKKAESISNWASYILLAIIAVVIVVLTVRHRRRDKSDFEDPASGQATTHESSAAPADE